MGVLNTLLGSFAKEISSLKVIDFEVAAYNDSVLTQMVDLNIDTQLDELGVFSDGSKTPDYSPYTIEMKKSEGKLYSHMNFDDTGETRESIDYIFDGELKVQYEDRFDLVGERGEVFGLTDDSIDYLKPEITENLQDFILSKL